MGRTLKHSNQGEFNPQDVIQRHIYVHLLQTILEKDNIALQCIGTAKLFSIYVPNMRYLVCVACAPSCYITWTFFPNSSYKRQLKIDWRCRCVSPFSSFKYVFVHSYSECCKNTKSMCPVSSCGPPPPSLTSRNGAKLWKHKHPLLSLCFALIK